MTKKVRIITGVLICTLFLLNCMVFSVNADDTPIFHLRNGEKDYIGEELPDAPVFNEYEFDGWYTEPDGRGEKLEGIPEADKEYYAAWKNGEHYVVTEPLSFAEEAEADGEEKYGYKWDGEALILDNCTVELKAVDENNNVAAELPNGGKIQLIGENKLLAGNTPMEEYYESVGLKSDCDVEIWGYGSLFVSGGDSDMISYGINVLGNFSCNSTVTCVGGNGDASYGIYCGNYESRTEIKENGTLTCIAGNTDSSYSVSCGAFICDELMIYEMGKLSGTGGEAKQGDSYGVYSKTAYVDGELEGHGGKSGGAWGTSAGVYLSYRYVEGEENVSAVISGKLKGIGNNSTGNSSSSVGIYCESAIYSSGNIVASCGKGTSESEGIYVIGGNVEFIGGEVDTNTINCSASSVTVKNDALVKVSSGVSLKDLSMMNTGILNAACNISASGKINMYNRAKLIANGKITAAEGIESAYAVLSGATGKFTSGMKSIFRSGNDPVVLQADCSFFDLNNGKFAADENDHFWKDYDFIGWFDNEKLEGEPITEGFSSDYSYYALWERDGVRVITETLDFETDTQSRSGYGYSWDEETKTLTLSGITADIEYMSVYTDAVIKLPDGATLVLSDGTDNIIIGHGNTVPTNGLWCTGNLKITGNGGLNAYAGESTQKSYGICVDGSLENESVIVGIGGKGASKTYGIAVFGGITNSGIMIGTSGENSTDTYGIYCSKDYVNSGAVNGTGALGVNNSYGLYIYSGKLINSGVITATATGAKYSNGINARVGGIEATSGTITAYAGKGQSEYFGIWTSGNIALSGTAVLNVSGNTDAPKKIAVSMSGTVTVSDTAALVCDGKITVGTIEINADGRISVKGTVSCKNFGDEYPVYNGTVEKVSKEENEDFLPADETEPLVIYPHEACRHAKLETISAHECSCISEGNNQYYYCKLCDKYFKNIECTVETTPEAEKLNKTDHRYETYEVIEPTQEAEGYTLYKCSVCGDEYEDDIKPMLPSAATYFDDVDIHEYYGEAVFWAYKKEITVGTAERTFSPEAECTRAQIFTFLWRAKGSPKPTITENPFTDIVEGEYYYDAILWAVENGLTTGTTPTTFSPDEVCTRAQVATLLWRLEGKPTPESEENPFTDLVPGEYYCDAVMWAAEKEITNGTSANTFSPYETCTRGQIVTFLYRALAEKE